MSNLVRNEGLKLFANWLNSLSVTILAAGVIAPVVSVTLEISPRSTPVDQLAKFAVICMCISLALHLQRSLSFRDCPMTNELGIMLIGPITVLIGATLMGVFVMWRIERYGRVFSWPPMPNETKQPPAPRQTEP